MIVAIVPSSPGQFVFGLRHLRNSWSQQHLDLPLAQHLSWTLQQASTPLIGPSGPLQPGPHHL
ncbi:MULTISPECIES: hypothetical protein [Cytobacillus]|uniref:hypothetical protein n=1 Tax=Cytobacillus TaxID=2675230 RepID=UPI0008DA5098|nr:hypothetical protein [Cytobacillus oceanisediminis]MBY0154169.1 hypothetical protein [Cytobacillus firmus]